MPNLYDIGDSVRVRGIFTVTGTPTDPDIVDLRVRDPSGNISSFSLAGGTVTKQSDGNFYRDIFLDEAGQWWYEFFGSGTVLAADEGYLIVERSVIP
jgi:hypothetical protein